LVKVAGIAKATTGVAEGAKAAEAAAFAWGSSRLLGN
jgi:hypothetical protein